MRKRCCGTKAALTKKSGNHDLENKKSGNERKVIKNGGLNQISEG